MERGPRGQSAGTRGCRGHRYHEIHQILSVPMSVAAYRWQSDRYEPALRRLAKVIGDGGEAPEVYCRVLEHKWFMSEKARDDVGLDVAMEDSLKRFAKA